MKAVAQWYDPIQAVEYRRTDEGKRGKSKHNMKRKLNILFYYWRAITNVTDKAYVNIVTHVLSMFVIRNI